MPTTRAVATALAPLIAAAGLSACGATKTKTITVSNGSPAATAATPPTTTSAPATTSSGGSGGATAKPGTSVALGTTEHVAFAPLSGKTGGTDALDVTVEKIEKGSQADLKSIQITGAQKSSTPYYITVKVANPGAQPPAGTENPTVRIQPVDDRGQEQATVTFIGTFPRCNDADPPKKFSGGASFTSCLVALVPGGGSIKSVRWEGADPYYTAPVTWK